MEKMKKTLALILAGTTLALSTGMPVIAVEEETSLTAAKAYVQQSTVYHYPITPDDPEWREFDSVIDMREACRIPPEILKTLSTEEVIEAALHYPLLIDFYAFDTYDDGLDALLKESDAFVELMTRPDRAEKLAARLQVQRTLDRSRSADLTFEQMILNDLLTLDRLSGNSICPYSEEQWEYITIHTPNGSPVTVIKKNEEYTTTIQQIKKEFYAKTYPAAWYLAPATPRYNCHSYAWVLRSPDNIFWLEDTSAYRYDGSYYSVSLPNAKAGDIVWYVNGHHSAVLESVSLAARPEKQMVVSKWGPDPLFRHTVDYCPYYQDTTSFTYWH